MKSIDRSEIEAWGKRQESKGDFPLLMAKLIFETTPRSTFFEIPSGSAVFLDGWDGFVKCEIVTGNVPEGISLWECKTNGGKTLADSDYEKRKQNSLGYKQSDVTFIFVTSKTWKGKKKWVEERLKENVWKDVRVYDAINLSNWINITEISLKWLSAQLGRSHNCLTAEDFWENWSVGPKNKNGLIILTPKVVTSGREFECQKLVEFLNGVPNLMAVKGSTKDEAIAFIIATAKLSSEQFNVQFNSKSLVIEYLQDFRLVKKSNFNLNLIAKFEDTSELHSAVGRNHHVLLPLGPDDPYNSRDIIILPILERDGQVQALIDSGLSEEEARRYSKEAARDITILKRLIGFRLKAKWESTEEVQELVPALLIGRWDETKEGDRKVLEKLSSESYDIYSEKLVKWLEVESPPLIKIGRSWRLASPLDAWTNLSNHLSVKDFVTLRECFLQVMTEVNPIFQLEANDRQMASFRGKESDYSAWCREGLTQSMILVSLYGDKLKFQHSFSAQDWVDEIIKKLLYDASGYLWASRNSEMPLIAEASPKSFFEAAYHSLSLDDKPIMDMFIEEDSWISSTSHHTGLLWALESLAWTEEYVFDASMLLARLASLDPGGKLTNRPINSLREIYKPWHYQTLASFDDRIKILEQIIIKEYETGWNLLSEMIPKSTAGSAFPTNKLRWRLFMRSFDQSYTWHEIFATHSQIIELLIKYFDFTEKKLIVLLEKSESKQIQPTDREKVLSFVESNLDKIKITDNSAWNELRNTLSQHRSSPDAVWALSESELKKYEAIYRKLEPSDPIEKVIWMFNDRWPNFPEVIDRKEFSFEEQEEFVTKRRVDGLIVIYKNFGFEFVKELTKTVKETWVYGDILARIIYKENDVLSLCECLKENESPILNFIQGFIYRKSLINGIGWVFELYEKLKETKFKGAQLANIFLQLEQTKTMWEFIEKISMETQNSYWKGIYPHFWGLPEDDMIYGIDKLLEASRFISALDIAYHKPEKLPTGKLIEILEKAGTQESLEDNRFDSNHTSRIIEILEAREDIDRSVLLRLEWLYLPFLASYGSVHNPSVLHEELANNPDFFIQVLTWVYKSDKEEVNEEDILDEAKRTKARNAYELLRSWKRIPGVDKNGDIDEDFLWSWINRVRDMAEWSGRLKVADIQIGNVVAEYPEKDQPWPPKEICKVIDSINTQSIKSGFSTATFNKRGSSIRGPFDGGYIERGHAKYFRSQADKIKYDFPVTAELLNRLADGYEKDAKRMDESAKRDNLEY